ncbi:MAG: hypothetical protein AB9828_01980 [Sphaerochaetaceae bacterium]
MNGTITLVNPRVTVELALPGEIYQGARFDRGGFIKQITLDNTHTFLGKEHTKQGPGTHGLGLIHGWIWKNTGILEKSTDIPILGVGTVHLVDPQPYDPRKDYTVEENTHETILHNDQWVTFVSHQVFADFLELRITRSFTLEDNHITILTTVENLGCMTLEAEEYNHDFLCFDHHPVDATYKVTLNTPLKTSMVRGEVVLGPHHYRPLAYEEKLGTIALIPDCQDYPQTTTTTVVNENTHTEAVLTDCFTPSRAYHWISPWCLCPENFKNITLKSGETETFTRSIAVDTLS